MSEKQLNFCIIGKVDNEQVFKEVVSLIDNLPAVKPKFYRISKSWFYITQDHKKAAKAGILRKNRRPQE